MRPSIRLRTRMLKKGNWFPNSNSSRNCAKLNQYFFSQFDFLNFTDCQRVKDSGVTLIKFFIGALTKTMQLKKIIINVNSPGAPQQKCIIPTKHAVISNLTKKQQWKIPTRQNNAISHALLVSIQSWCGLLFHDVCSLTADKWHVTWKPLKQSQNWNIPS